MNKSSSKETMLSPEKLAMLEARLKQRGFDTLRVPPIGRRNGTGPSWPLSFAQQRLWFLHLLEPEGTAYLLPSVIQLHGRLDAQFLERSLQELVMRHECLRTTFEEQSGHPVQIIHPARKFTLPLVDLRAFTPETCASCAYHLAEQEKQHPCDLRVGPLLRAWLLRLDEQVHVLLITMHHIISDGWSNQVFYRELTVLYGAFIEGKPSPLPPLSIQYADFACWQRAWLQGAILEQHLAYWRTQMAGVSPLELPIDHPRPPIPTHRGAVQTLVLPFELQQKLQVLSQQQKQVTLFMLLLTAFQILLFLYSGQQDIAVGTPIANRTRGELEGLIGFFVNSLVVRTQIQGHLSFLQLLEQVREICLSAYAHQDVPFEQLVEHLHPERDLSRSPLFQVMFGVQQVEPHSSEDVPTSIRDLHVQQGAVEHTTAKFDLTWNVTNDPNGIRCAVEYSTDLFEASTIQGLLQHWQTVLERIVVAPQEPVVWLSLLRAEEVQELLLLGTGKPIQEATPDWCLPRLVSQRAQVQPDALAVVSEETCLSYSMLDRRANQVARLLREQYGVQTEAVVAIEAERTVVWLICLLAVLKAGGTYLPMDVGLPVRRRQQILAQAQPCLYLTLSTREKTRNKEDRGPASWQEGFVVHLEITRLWPQIVQCADQPPATSIEPEQLAYIIYTSGSTGAPKGVQVPHRGLGNLAQEQGYAFGVSQQSRILQWATPGFDASIAEIAVSLVHGASLHLAAASCLLPGRELIALMQERAITIVTLPPSALAHLLWEPLPALQTFISAGEACSVESVERWQPGRSFWNAYGPTEATVCASMQRCVASELRKSGPRIGHPLGLVEMYVLDSQGQLLPHGVAGELVIGGVGLARGYLGLTQETAERFMPHPYSEHPGARLYRTGDRARWRADGTLEYLGRRDKQVKLRGYRIELGEIEQIVREHASVEECVAIVREKREGDTRLLVYVEPRSQDEPPDAEILRRYMQERLPEYMVPGQIVVLKRFPLLPNGKLDRQRLPLPEAIKKVETGQEERTPIEELLGQIWMEVLDSEEVRLDDNFFDLGGHSLLATQIIARIQALLGIELPVQSLFEVPTITLLAQRVERELQKEHGLEVPPLLPAKRGKGPVSLSFAQQRLWFLDQLEPGNTAYLISSIRHLDGRLDQKVLERSLQELVERHESLRTTFVMRDERPVQIIHPAGKLALPFIDLSALGKEERRWQTRCLIEQGKQQPCDLQRGPLLHVRLLYIEEQEHVLLIRMHHIISDGWSNEIFYRDLTALYSAFIEGRPSPLAPLPVQYADFALWQRSWLQGEILQQHLDYWKKQLSGAVPVMLPTDYPRPDIRSYQGASHVFILPSDLSKDLVMLSKREQVTLFMALLAAFQILLYRYTGQTDIVVGTDVANRTHVGTENLIGFFINLLAVRTNFDRVPPFRNALHAVRKTLLESYRHQDVPFDMLVDYLRMERTMNKTPLINLLFVMQNVPGTTKKSPHVENTAPVAELTTSKFDLAFFVHEGTDAIFGTIRYSTDLFEHHTIVTMAQHFEVLLRDIVARPNISVDALNLFTNVDKARKIQEQQRQRTVKGQSLKNAKAREIESRDITRP